MASTRPMRAFDMAGMVAAVMIGKLVPLKPTTITPVMGDNLLRRGRPSCILFCATAQSHSGEEREKGVKACG